MDCQAKKWGQINGIDSELYIIKDNNTGFEVQLTDIGASIVRVKMPDKDGLISDIHYGRNSPEAIYENLDRGYLGSIVGRVASTTMFSRFELDGKIYELSKNNFITHHSHGGVHGFNTKKWDCIEKQISDSEVVLTFQYISPDGEEGYPGNLNTQVKYIVNQNMNIIYEITATTDKPTILNIINHGYWNLDGVGNLIDNLKLKLYSERFLDLDMKMTIKQTLLHILKIKKYPKEQPFEFKNSAQLGIYFNEFKSFKQAFIESGDIDQRFELTNYNANMDPNDIFLAAELISPNTGRKMSVLTNQPYMIVYTGNDMQKMTAFGEKQQKHAAVCLETGTPTNAINIPGLEHFQILRPGDRYFHKTVHKYELI